MVMGIFDTPRKLKRLAGGAAMALFGIGIVLTLTTGRVSSWLFRPGQDSQDLEVALRSVSFWVEANGILRATSVQNYGGPPAFRDYWQFQLVSMVAEGKNVKKGEVLISFDAQRVREDLQRLENELDQATKELEKVKAQIDLERQELVARLAAAQNKHDKLKLKQRTSPTIDSPLDVQRDELAIKQAEREVEALNQQLEWHKRSSDASYKIIASKKARAEAALNEIKRGMEGFQAKAERDGVVVYKTKWNGERFQVGESIWSGFPILEIPDLNTILAEAFVPEVDIGRVKIGQPAEISIDAFPGKTYQGRVKSVGTLVRPKSWDIQNKILEVQIELDQLDTSIMRPGMSIKAKIETTKLAEVLAIPMKAVRTTAAGALVKVRRDSGWSERRVVLGDSNGTDVVINEGLNPGERVAAEFAKARWKGKDEAGNQAREGSCSGSCGGRSCVTFGLRGVQSASPKFGGGYTFDNDASAARIHYKNTG